MMQQEGKLLTCDRCGATAFVLKTGSYEQDGGYTRYNAFEAPPEGWDSTRDVNFADLCPSCAAEYKKIILEFYAEKGREVSDA